MFSVVLSTTNTSYDQRSPPYRDHQMEQRYTPERGTRNFTNTSSNRARQSHDRYDEDDDIFEGNHSEPTRGTYGSDGELYDRDRRNHNHRRNKKSRRSHKR